MGPRQRASSVLSVGGWKDSWERASTTRSTGGWVDHRERLDAVANTQISAPAWNCKRFSGCRVTTVTELHQFPKLLLK